MNLQDIETELEAFLRKRFRISARDRRFSRQINLWEEGYVDSLSGVELVNFLEKTYQIRMPEDVFHDISNASITGLATTALGLIAK